MSAKNKAKARKSAPKATPPPPSLPPAAKSLEDDIKEEMNAEATRAAWDKLLKLDAEIWNKILSLGWPEIPFADVLAAVALVREKKDYPEKFASEAFQKVADYEKAAASKNLRHHLLKAAMRGL